MKYILVVLVALSFSLVEAQITEKPEFGKLAITGGTVYTITNGTLENATILIEGEKITSVGVGIAVPDGFTVINAAGKEVYPGFMDSGSQLGLVEVGQVPVTVDSREIGDYNPNVLAFTAFNPHSAAIPVTRVSGVTHVLTAPSSGLIAGQASIMDLWGYSPDSMAIDPTAAMVVEWPSSGRRGFFDRRSDKEIKEDFEGNLKELNDKLDKARFYESMMSVFEANPTGKNQPDKDIRLDAMRATVRGETPVLVNVSREKDILTAIEWATDEKNSNLNIVFINVQEGWRVADKIAEAGIPCLVKALYLPVRDYDHVHRPYENAGALHKAGVKVAMISGEIENVRNLSFEAGYAAAYGLGREEALKAVTINPAEIFGIADLVGSIEAGKQANLFIANGDPFEPVTQIEQVFIKGYKIPMVSRHTQLYEEFLDRDAVNN
ncbi:MAG: amidohydrolase family protein [Balneola sp.]